MDYREFIESRLQANTDNGIKPIEIPDYLYDFQKSLVEWALIKGRAAIFADCGLGKTPMQLVWSDNIVRHTNKPVLILTPLAVSYQTEQEASKFNIDAKRSEKEVHYITITNYEKLKHFNSSDFSGIVCDESSILKNFDGKRKSEITEFMRKIPYRLLATATAAPNDYVELGTSSEALGNMGHIDMLNKYFKNDQNNSTNRRLYGRAMQWRFKGHAEQPFWRWVCSWGRALRKPSDIGYNDNDFILPGLVEREVRLDINKPLDDRLFHVPATNMQEHRKERKNTIIERCEKTAELCNHDRPVIIWCNLNEEGDYLEKIIPNSLQVAGKHSDQVKEERLIGFKNKEFRVLITKPKIGAWGLNYQHCSDIICYPTYSYEQYYQGVRRCYRFGQKNTVKVDFVTTEGDKYLFKALQTKAKNADRMFDNLIENMNNANSNFTTKQTKKEDVPEWLTSK